MANASAASCSASVVAEPLYGICKAQGLSAFTRSWNVGPSSTDVKRQLASDARRTVAGAGWGWVWSAGPSSDTRDAGLLLFGARGGGARGGRGGGAPPR